MKKMIFIMLANFCFALSPNDFSKLKEQDIKGSFTQTKSIVNFKKPIITSGDYEFKNNELFWNITKPIQSNTKINKDGIYNLIGNSWVKSEARYDKSLFLSIIHLDFDALKNDFDIAIQGDESSWYIFLQPKSYWIKKIFSSIKVKGAKKIENIEINEQNGDISQIEFHE